VIHYSLHCASGHDFEAWFRSSDDYGQQAAGKLVHCPVCASDQVEKSLMAPTIVTARTSQGRPPEAIADTTPSTAVEVATPPPLDAMPPEMHDMVARLRELKARLIENSEHVGTGFAEEARKIHYGEAPARPVHGEATLDDARALIEEGIDILPLPPLPEEFN
jgi:hypothetical protein